MHGKSSGRVRHHSLKAVLPLLLVVALTISACGSEEPAALAAVDLEPVEETVDAEVAEAPPIVSTWVAEAKPVVENLSLIHI